MKFMHLSSVNSEQNCFKSFNDALLVWIRKPHVINRTLCGADIIYETNLPDKADLLKFEFSENIIPSQNDELKLKLILNKLSLKMIEEMYHEFRDGQYYVCIRQQIPKSTKKKGVYELIIQNLDKHETYFTLLCENNSSSDGENDLNEFDGNFSNTTYKIGLSDDGKIINLAIDENYPATSKFSSYSLSLEWLKNTLLKKILKWSQEEGLNTDIKSLVLVNVNDYNMRYNDLKDKYGKHFVNIWTENTDPLKYVYEDIGIAAYLLLIWEKYDKNNGVKSQCFVDVGCGNGLLVYILNSEGYRGYGVDIRSRKIWDKLKSKADLRVQTVIPTDKNLFVDADWLIGNHSDELTPWIPVMAARSENLKCQYFVIPCCPWDFTKKFSHGCKSKEIDNSGKYGEYLSFIHEVGEVCGFDVQRDVLRIPSTRMTCFVGLTDVKLNKNRHERLSDIEYYMESRSNKSMSNQNNINGVNFKPRESVEKIKNALAIDRKIIEDIWVTVLNELLKIKNDFLFDETESNLTVQKFENAIACHELLSKPLYNALANYNVTKDCKKWNKGGTISLAKVSELFRQDILNVLKSECGGLQTVLKNCPDVFSIQAGHVSLRDWKSLEFEEYLKWRRNKNSSNSKNPDDRKKTKMCFYHDHHPDGCPLKNNECRFAHGISDLNTTVPTTILNKHKHFKNNFVND